MFHFARYKYLKTLESRAIIKLEKRFFLLRRVGYVSTSYCNSYLGIRYFCCLCLRWQCFVYPARVSESQTHMEDWLRDSVFVFPSSCDLCGLVRILLWFECLGDCPVCLAGQFCFGQRKFPCGGFCSIIVNRQKDRNVL